eukprot:43876-Amphidinium_carterae.1
MEYRIGTRSLAKETTSKRPQKGTLDTTRDRYPEGMNDNSPCSTCKLPEFKTRGTKTTLEARGQTTESGYAHNYLWFLEAS